MNFIYRLYKKLSIRLRRRNKNFKTEMPLYGNIDLKLLYSSPYNKTSIVPSIIYYISFDDNDNTFNEYLNFKKILSINTNCRVINDYCSDTNKYISVVSIIGKSLYVLKKYSESSYNKENIFLNMILTSIKEDLPMYEDSVLDYSNIFNSNIEDIYHEYGYTQDPIYTNTQLQKILVENDDPYVIVCVNGNNLYDELIDYFSKEEIYSLISIDIKFNNDMCMYYLNNLNVNGYKNTYILNLLDTWNIYNVYLTDIIKNDIIYNDNMYIDYINKVLDKDIYETLNNKYMSLLNNKSIFNNEYDDIDEIIE